jgi:hypothetical protein
MAALIPLAPLTAEAQDAQSTGGSFEDVPVPSWGKAVLDSFEKPVHPVIGGVVSGGGLGFGVGYDSPDDDRWYREGDAIVTIRRYWLLQGEFGRRSLSRRSTLGAFGAVRDMNRIDYFGIGTATALADRSAFSLRETTVGARGSHRPIPAFRFGGSAALYVSDIGRGANQSVPSIEQRFVESTVPGGFSVERTFGRYRGFVEFMYPAAPAPERINDIAESLQYRGIYQLTAERVRDHKDGTFNFHRWESEMQQRIPGLRAGQLLTLHSFLAWTNPGDEVPFYLQYALGGSGGLKAFRPDLIGSDGTRATLRGFRNYRFRDRNALLLQAEYRIPLHRSIHSSVFVDSGQVAPRVPELFDNLHTSTGFSLSYVRKGRALGRMDVGFGGGEGVQLFWSFGLLD